MANVRLYSCPRSALLSTHRDPGRAQAWREKHPCPYPISLTVLDRLVWLQRSPTWYGASRRGQSGGDRVGWADGMAGPSMDSRAQHVVVISM